jgi:hypothetical protein
MPLEAALSLLSVGLLLGLGIGGGLLRTRLLGLRHALRRAEAWRADAQYTARALSTLAQVQRLAEGGVALGTQTVREIHKGIASIPFGILEAIPATRDSSRLVRALHDQTADVVYGSIGLVNRVLGRGLRRGLGLDGAQAGAVRDLSALRQFIAGRPSPEAFRRRYPDVELVLPDVAELPAPLRPQSQFVAVLDDDGRICGGELR